MSEVSPTQAQLTKCNLLYVEIKNYSDMDMDLEMMQQGYVLSGDGRKWNKA